jgi:hypothetical protein
LTRDGGERYPGRVERLELTRIRVCDRCGRGSAELRAASGASIVVTLDPVRARQLRDRKSDDGRTLTEVLLEAIQASGAAVSEVVLDVSAERLGGLVSLIRDGDSDVVGCTAEEAVALAVRGDLRIYATAEALAHAAARPAKAAPHGGAGGPETIH